MKPLIIFGPSGVGKGTIINFLQSKHPDLFKLNLSFTTRKPRKGQIHGEHYFFVSKQQFNQKLQYNEMLQHKFVYGNLYGTCKKYIQEIVNNKKIPIFDVDAQGMLDIHKCIKQTIKQKLELREQIKIQKPLCLCIMPPNLKLLRQRLAGRKTQSEEVIQKRMQQNIKRIQQMIAIETMGIQHLYYVTNYQYQLTTYGIQCWLKQNHKQFAKYKQNQKSYFSQENLSKMKCQKINLSQSI